eukprot:310865_1
MMRKAVQLIHMKSIQEQALIMLVGTINPYEIKYYRVDFESEIQGMIVLESCGSDFETEVNWYDSNMIRYRWDTDNVIFDVCGDGHILMIINPGAGTYYVG